MNRLEVRGTIRIALKEAGLDPQRVSSHQMGAVVAQVLPDELLKRGIDDAPEVCRALDVILKSHPDDETVDAGDRIDGLFRRTL
ncbi:MAG: hypothetical protein ACQGVK_04130 [Myxococcota bacterium]